MTAPDGFSAAAAAEEAVAQNFQPRGRCPLYESTWGVCVKMHYPRSSDPASWVCCWLRCTNKCPSLSPSTSGRRPQGLSTHPVLRPHPTHTPVGQSRMGFPLTSVPSHTRSHGLKSPPHCAPSFAWVIPPGLRSPLPNPASQRPGTRC